jgi:alkylated DNA nucleotide flippase Atl1
MSAGKSAQAAAVALLLAMHHDDHLTWFRVLRDIRRNQETDAVIGQLSSLYLFALKQLHGDDSVQVDAELECMLRDVQDSA